MRDSQGSGGGGIQMGARRWLVVAACILTLACASGGQLPPGEYTIETPPTPTCPSGRWIVNFGGTAGSLKCIEGQAPSPTPETSPAPSPEPQPSPSPEPAPSPSPSASPAPSPDPSPSHLPPPIGADGNYPLPAPGTCPSHFDHPPSRVGLGDEPRTQTKTSKRHVVTFHMTPKDVKPFCPHRPGATECEQWIPCAELQANVRGESPMIWFSEYPGFGCNRDSDPQSRDCGVEHPSRDCTRSEQAEDETKGAPGPCKRPHAFVGRDVIGTGGGPPGIRGVCAAPYQRKAEAQCRRWWIDLNGWEAR